MVVTTQRWGCLNFAALVALVILFSTALAIAGSKLAHSGVTMFGMMADMRDATLFMNSSMGTFVGDGAPLMDTAKQQHTVEVFTQFLNSLTPLVQNVDPAAVTNMTNAAATVLHSIVPIVEAVKPGDVREIIELLRNFTQAANDVAQRLDHGGGLSLHLEGT